MSRKTFQSSHLIPLYAQETFIVIIAGINEHCRNHVVRLNEHRLCCHFQADKFWPNLHWCYENISYSGGGKKTIYPSSCFGIWTLRGKKSNLAPVLYEMHSYIRKSHLFCENFCFPSCTAWKWICAPEGCSGLWNLMHFTTSKYKHFQGKHGQETWKTICFLCSPCQNNTSLQKITASHIELFYQIFSKSYLEESTVHSMYHRVDKIDFLKPNILHSWIILLAITLYKISEFYCSWVVAKVNMR